MEKINLQDIDGTLGNQILPAQLKAYKELRDSVPAGSYHSKIDDADFEIEYYGAKSNGYWNVEAWITAPSGKRLVLPLDGVAPDGEWNWEKIKKLANGCL